MAIEYNGPQHFRDEFSVLELKPGDHYTDFKRLR